MFTRLLAGAAFLGFAGLTARTLAEHSYLEFFDIATSNAAIGLLFTDLVICLALIGAWILLDARRLGIAGWPFVGIAAFFGAAGPLLYLVRRPASAAASRPADVAMPRGRPAAAIVLVLFAGITFHSLARHGVLAMLLWAGANAATELLVVDLLLCLLLISVWLVCDARRTRGAWFPFVLIGASLGAIGPLLYLVTRGWGRRVQLTAGGAVLALSPLVLSVGSGHADIRNAAARHDAPESERRGRERLRRLAERHGLAAFRRHATMESVARDRWKTKGWWPAPEQRFRAQALLGTFTSRVELLDGPGRGEVWGIQAWAPYESKAAGMPIRFVLEPRPAISFYLPTLQYFNELPFRIGSASFVRDAGAARLFARDYDLVLASWGGEQPNPDHDQYLLFIDRESGLLSKVRYTVREIVQSAEPSRQAWLRSLALGTMHYEDYRNVGGVMVPFLQTIVLPPPELTRPPLSEHFFHRLELEDVRFDAVSADDLRPDAAREEAGDRKLPGLSRPAA